MTFCKIQYLELVVVFLPRFCLDLNRKMSGRRARRENGEDDSLSSIAREAEARLAAKRAARAEAREIRLKELEKAQREVHFFLWLFFYDEDSTFLFVANNFA